MRPIRYGDRRQVLTSVSDTTLILAPPMKRHFLITGSGVLYWVQLPDARYMKVGDALVFENGSSEIVGVMNSSSVTWERIMPREGVTCVLADASTAAGVWDVYYFTMPIAQNGFRDFNDYTGHAASSSYYGNPALTGYVNGAGAAVSVYGSTLNANWKGVANHQTGTTNTGYAYSGISSNGFTLGGGPVGYYTRLNVSALSDGVETYIVRAGISDNTTGGAPTNGVYILYDQATDGNLYALININTLGNNKLVTGVAPAQSATLTTSNDLRLEVSATGSRSDFWIDKVQVSPAGGLGFGGPIYIPGTAVAVRSGIIGITKTVGTTSRQLRVDYQGSYFSQTTPR